MSNDVIGWIAGKIAEMGEFETVARTPEGFLSITSNNGKSFLLAVLGVKGVIERANVEPFFVGRVKPDFVVNVPSKVKWNGPAIHRIHSENAAFGTFGEITKACHLENVGDYRNKGMSFFINSMRQHTNVLDITYVYQNVFWVERRVGEPLTVAVIEAYNMSAEDVRNARTEIGSFDIVVKASSYGSITSNACDAAQSMGSEALTFKELMARLGK